METVKDGNWLSEGKRNQREGETKAPRGEELITLEDYCLLCFLGGIGLALLLDEESVDVWRNASIAEHSVSHELLELVI